MNRLTVFYDRHCALCRACRGWLEGQPKFVELRFVPYQSEEAFRICPSLGEFEPDREIVVLSDNGNLYTGGAAWVMCLYALREYRDWAVRLAHPALLPLAKRICHQISHNRLRLSRLFFERSVDAITRDVHAMGPGDGDEEGAACTRAACRT